MANRGAQFVSTRWSIVLDAGHGGSQSSRRALAELCETYWLPVYAFVRKRGHAPQDAEDLTQAFFAALLSSGTVADADSSRGRFRSFLLACVVHFLSNERDRANALKRGGGRTIESIDVEWAEGGYRFEPVEDETPETVFERRWALALLDRVLSSLEAEYERNGNASRFARLKPFLTGEGDDGYAAAADDIGISEGAAKVAVHRLRRRYRELLRAEVAETVGCEELVDDELRALREALGPARTRSTGPDV